MSEPGAACLMAWEDDGGSVEAVPGAARVAATLYQCGYFTEPQLRRLDEFPGLPEPSHGSDTMTGGGRGMIRAWRRADGRYRLEDGEGPWVVFRRLMAADIDWCHDERGWRVIPAEGVEMIGAEKVFGVITGPSSCGCEPARFRWVTEGEVEAGVTAEKECETCSYRDPTSARLRFVKSRHRCDIIDVLGEADVAEATYEAEFKGKLEAVS